MITRIGLTHCGHIYEPHVRQLLAVGNMNSTADIWVSQRQSRDRVGIYVRTAGFNVTWREARLA